MEKGEDYKLLPLRFTPLDQSQYVVTNMVGEYHVLRRDAVHALVKRTLDPNTPDYDELKAKHFLSDDDLDVAL